MQDAAWRFGDGATLPFTPCKKGYKPWSTTTNTTIAPTTSSSSTEINNKSLPERMYACPLHDQERRKRVAQEGGKFRQGEVDLERLFWQKGQACSLDAASTTQELSSKEKGNDIGLTNGKISKGSDDVTRPPKKIRGGGEGD